MDDGIQKPRERKSARGPRTKKPAEEGKDGPQEMKYQQKGPAPTQDATTTAAPKAEKKPKQQQYRQKGEPKEGAGEDQAVPV